MLGTLRGYGVRVGVVAVPRLRPPRRGLLAIVSTMPHATWYTIHTVLQPIHPVSMVAGVDTDRHTG